MKLRFTKMHGLGNDFVVIDLVTQHLTDSKLAKLTSADYIRHLSDRNFGVGFDQMLLVEPPINPTSDFCYRIFNADGSEVEQCGNGARCFARFVAQRRLTKKNDIRVDVANGTIVLHIHQDKTITVDMGAPIFEPAQIPVATTNANAVTTTTNSPAQTLNLMINGESIEATCLSMGNPHAVIIVDDIEQADVQGIGEAAQQHACFPQSVNVGFMQIISPSQINLRVYERGAGETLACGTGACAAVVAGQSLGLLDDNVNAQLRGGKLHLHYALSSGYNAEETVKMTGPAQTVFHGTIYL